MQERRRPAVDRPTRMLFIAHDAGLFGAQRVLLTLLQGLVRYGYVCHVVAAEDGPFVSAARALGCTVHLRHMVRWVPAIRDVERAGLIRYALRCLAGVRERAWSVAGLVKRHQIDVVYTNTVTCVEGAVAARMASVPHVWYITEPISGNPELRGILPVFVYGAALGALSTEIVFCSQSLAANYGSLSRRSRVVYPGVPMPPLLDRPTARASLLARLGAGSDRRLVGVIAALQPRKDHATFLEAARLICARRRDVDFLIVGAGNASYTAEIEERICALGLEGHTRLLGWWPGEIHDLVAGLDVLVISSIQESFGLTAVEALALQTPVVSTRCGGPAEIVRDGVDGTLVPVGDAPSMARAIEAQIDDPAAAAALARSGYERVTAVFTTDRYVRGLEQILKAAMGVRQVGAAEGTTK